MFMCVVYKRGWFRLRDDLYCVEWGVKLYSLTAMRRSRSARWRAASATILRQATWRMSAKLKLDAAS